MSPKIIPPKFINRSNELLISRQTIFGWHNLGDGVAVRGLHLQMLEQILPASIHGDPLDGLVLAIAPA